MKEVRAANKVFIQNAWQLASKNVRNKPLWVFMRDLCGVGSTTAHALCKIHGWNPHAKGFKSISPDKPTNPTP